MPTLTLDLLFLEPGKGDPLGPTISHLYVKHHGRKKYKGVSADLILLGAECFSIIEIESEIKRLQNELEVLRKKARKKYAGYKAKVAKPSYGTTRG